MAWMITGAGKQQPTKWGGGSIACKTAFKSWAKVRTSEGRTENPTTKDGQYVFEEVKPRDTVNFKVFTGADETKAASDEFYVYVMSMNWTYMANLANQIYTTATPEQKQVWSNNREAFEQYLQTQINWNNMFVTYYSQIETTNSEGEYQGKFTIPNNWPTGPMVMVLDYGYNNDARSGDASRAFSNLLEVASWAVLAVEVLVLGLSCPVTAGAGCVALAAVFAAEMSVLFYEQLSQGLSKQIGRNKYGCSFPEGGYKQIYALNIVNPSNDPFNLANPETKEVLERDRVNVTTTSNDNSKLIVLGVAFSGFMIALVSLMRGGE